MKEIISALLQISLEQDQANKHSWMSPEVCIINIMFIILKSYNWQQMDSYNIHKWQINAMSRYDVYQWFLFSKLKI
jgi:hypothetical protein